MIRRRSSASSSFVLAATRLRALTPTGPLPHGDVTRAAARKIPENSQNPGPAGNATQVTGSKTHALLTPVALVGPLSSI